MQDSRRLVSIVTRPWGVPTSLQEGKRYVDDKEQL
jgi:hypothetical protein